MLGKATSKQTLISTGFITVAHQGHCWNQPPFWWPLFKYLGRVSPNSHYLWHQQSRQGKKTAFCQLRSWRGHPCCFL